MRYVTVRDFRNHPAQIWKKLQKENEMVVTSNGRPVALLTPLSESTVDTTLSAIRKARAIAAVIAMQTKSLHNNNSTLSQDAINEEINTIRQRRRK